MVLQQDILIEKWASFKCLGPAFVLSFAFFKPGRYSTIFPFSNHCLFLVTGPFAAYVAVALESTSPKLVIFQCAPEGTRHLCHLPHSTCLDKSQNCLDMVII